MQTAKKGEGEERNPEVSVVVEDINRSRKCSDQIQRDRALRPKKSGSFTSWTPEDRESEFQIQCQVTD
jgi:hypothetical protein